MSLTLDARWASAAWLAPSAASLVAWARRTGPDLWADLRDDPGAVLLFCRLAARLHSGPPAHLPRVALTQPAILEHANRWLTLRAPAFVDWGRPGASAVYLAALRHARLARAISEHCERADPEAAWAAGLLAPLGWFVVCAREPARAAACLADPRLLTDAPTAQRSHWGMDAAAIARRVAHRWRLPGWLSTVAGALALPMAVAEGLGADADLFAVVRLAASRLDHRGVGLGLSAGTDVTESAAHLGWTAADDAALAADWPGVLAGPPRRDWVDPSTQPLLPELLALAAEARRARSATSEAELHTRLDRLQDALTAERSAFAGRLQRAKLEALAELAAGAGHEINNPLAVISGQAQYLLNREADPSRQRSLQTVIRQVGRIHDILVGLMQFARPPRPAARPVDVAELLGKVAAALADVAETRRVRLEMPSAVTSPLLADPAQVQTALTALVRNGLEAAPADGWVRVRAEASRPGWLALVVEDSGPGPTAEQREHLFDPFYCGRPAGRGRGLGLPTAWRLARQHGGDVRFEPAAAGDPTRFVLELPTAEPGTGRRSA